MLTASHENTVPLHPLFKLKQGQHLISGSLLGKKGVRPGAIIPASAPVLCPYKTYHRHKEITRAWQKGPQAKRSGLAFCSVWALTSVHFVILSSNKWLLGKKRLELMATPRLLNDQETVFYRWTLIIPGELTYFAVPGKAHA